MMIDNPLTYDNSPDDPQLVELIRRFREAEAALQLSLNHQVDAVLDPTDATPILLPDTQNFLRVSEARYRRLYSRMAAIVFELNPDGVVLFVNEAVFDVLGYTWVELQGRNWWDTLLPGTQHDQVEALYRRFQNGDVTKYELTLTSKAGLLYIIELNSANRIDLAGNLVRILGVGIDITGRRKAESQLSGYRAHLERLVAERTAELSAANAALQLLADERQKLLLSEQTARVEADRAVQTRDEFLAMAAHELKTPVTSLRGFAELLAHQFTSRGTVDPVRLDFGLKTIVNQSTKLTTLIEQLLDISRLEVGRLTLEKQVVDMVVLVNEVVEQMQQTTALHKISVDSPPMLSALLDPIRLEQVLVNLIGNAIKYSPAGGAITVELLTSDVRTMQLRVTDQGMGIPPERRAHVFERFYQAHGQGFLGGMGLGLYISKEIVDLHGGQIAVEFPSEGGTRFVVTLPLNDYMVEPDPT